MTTTIETLKNTTSTTQEGTTQSSTETEENKQQQQPQRQQQEQESNPIRTVFKNLVRKQRASALATTYAKQHAEDSAEPSVAEASVRIANEVILIDFSFFFSLFSSLY